MSEDEMGNETMQAWQQSRYGQAMAQAEERKRTHYDRERALTVAHFERHPECKQEIIRVRDDGVVVRDPNRFILVSARLEPDWWQYVTTWRGFDVRRVRVVERDALRNINTAIKRLHRLKRVA
jgi:hypothetical protein